LFYDNLYEVILQQLSLDKWVYIQCINIYISIFSLIFANSLLFWSFCTWPYKQILTCVFHIKILHYKININLLELLFYDNLYEVILQQLSLDKWVYINGIKNITSCLCKCNCLKNIKFLQIYKISYFLVVILKIIWLYLFYSAIFWCSFGKIISIKTHYINMWQKDIDDVLHIYF
jgi:hypothetical protein